MTSRGEGRSRAAGSKKLEKYLARKKALKSQPKRRIEERQVSQYDKDPRIQCAGEIWEYGAVLSLHKNDGPMFLYCVNQCADVLTHKAATHGSMQVWGSISFSNKISWKKGRESPMGSFFTNARDGDTIIDIMARLDCDAVMQELGQGSAASNNRTQDDRRWYHEATGCTFEFSVQTVVKRKRLRRPFPLSHRYHYNSAWKANIMHNLPSESTKKHKAVDTEDAGLSNVGAQDPGWRSTKIRFAVAMGLSLAILVAVLAVAGQALKAAATA
jgi:hypothetical protein